MRRLFLFLISLLVGLTLFIWIGRVVGWQEIKRAFLILVSWQGLVILLLTLAVQIIGTWQWREILKSGGNNIPFKSLFGPYLVSSSLMYFFPIAMLGGWIFQAQIIKEKYSVPRLKGIASVIGERILDWTIQLAVIFFGILFLLSKISYPPKKIFLIFGAVTIFFIIGFPLFYLKIFRGESIIELFLKKFGLRLSGQENSILDLEKEIFDFFKSKKRRY